MKNINFVILFALLSAGVGTACNESSSSDALAALGDVCNASVECASNYCSEDHVCAVDPNDLLENGEACEAHKECRSTYCNEKFVCAIKPGSTNTEPTQKGEEGADCNADAECQSNKCLSKKCVATSGSGNGSAGDSCSENSQCVSNNCVNGQCIGSGAGAGDGAEGAVCSGNGDCKAGLYCLANACVTLDTIGHTECSSDSASFCADNNAVTCRVYSEQYFIYQIEACKQDSACINMNSIAVCADPCTAEQVGQVTSKCDPDQKSWDGYVNGLILFKCTEVNGSYYRVATGYEVCPLNDFCFVDGQGCI